MREGVAFAHEHGAKVLVAINTFPRAGAEEIWHAAIADAQSAGVDAVILADMGLLAHAALHHPTLRRHLSVQAAAANADTINFYAREFGVKRVVLPRVLSVQEIAAINAETEVETEVFVFGGLCVMAEGRCSLSSYATGQSPNMNGVCSPASHVEYHEDAGVLSAKLGGYTIHRVAPVMRPPTPPCAKDAFTRARPRATCSRIPSASTPKNSSRNWPRRASPRSRSRAVSVRALMWRRWCAISAPPSMPMPPVARCPRACWPPSPKVSPRPPVPM